MFGLGWAERAHVICYKKYMADMLVEGQNLSIQYSLFNVGDVEAVNVKVKHPRDKNLQLMAGSNVDFFEMNFLEI